MIPFLQTFNAPDGLTSIGKRGNTTVAPQALLLMNNPLVLKCGAGFARRVWGKEDAIQAAYLIAFGRPPTSEERRDARAFVTAASWENFCQILLISNEFWYVR